MRQFSAFLLTVLLANPVLASADPAAAPASPIAGFLPLVLIFVIFYFLMIRPQQKKFKEHQAMVKALKRGDKVITNGGIMGTVDKIESDNIVHVEIASGVVVQVARHSISELVNKDKDKVESVKSATPKAKKAKDAETPQKQVANDN